MNLLEVNFCTHKAAKYAVENYHYSKILPRGKLVKFGVWEDKKFIGVVIFSRGASPFLGKFFELDLTEICELTRVALTSHDAKVTQILSISLKKLKELNPNLKAVVSFADPRQGHLGKIYQAGNWIFTGESAQITEYFIGGRWRHTRNSYHHPARKTAPTRLQKGKLRYIYPLEKNLRRKVLKFALPYPHAVEGLEESQNNSIIQVQVQSLPTALERLIND